GEPHRADGRLVPASDLNRGDVVSIAHLRVQRVIDVLREERRKFALLFSIEAENHALVGTNVAVSNQPAEQPAFFEAALCAEPALSIQNVKQVPRQELIGTPPPFRGHQAMIGRKSNLVSFLCAQSIHLLYSGLKHGRGGPECAGVETRVENHVDGLPRPRERVGSDESSRGVDQRVTGNAWISRLDHSLLWRWIF